MGDIKRSKGAPDPSSLEKNQKKVYHSFKNLLYDSVSLRKNLTHYIFVKY